jgi:hypothetical protein
VDEKESRGEPASAPLRQPPLRLPPPGRVFYAHAVLALVEVEAAGVRMGHRSRFARAQARLAGSQRDRAAARQRDASAALDRLLAVEDRQANAAFRAGKLRPGIYGDARFSRRAAAAAARGL